MKKLFTLILGLGMVAGANAQNPFAYGLSTDGNVVSPSAGALTVNVNYSLNADAESVNALIKDAEGNVVKTLPLAGIKKGVYENVELDLMGIGHGDFTWAIEVKGGATSGAMTEFTSWKFYHPCGLDVDNSFESPSFGTLFVTEGKHPSGLLDVNSEGESDYTGGISTEYISYPNFNGNVNNAGGLYMFTPTLESIKGKDGYARFYDSDLVWSDLYVSKSQADFSRVAVADDGRIFVARCNSAGDYILVAESLEALKNGEEFTSLVEGKTMTDAIYHDENGNFLLGAVQGFDVKGAGEDTKLMAITRNKNSITVSYSINRVKEYALGNATQLPSPTAVTVLDGTYTLSYDRSADVKYDNRGGIWYCQYQTQTDKVRLVYVDANGEEKYKDLTGLYRRGAIAISNDGTQIALGASGSGQIDIYNVSFNENGEPTLAKTEFTTKPGGGNLYALAWDAAGNVYAGNAGMEYVKGFAVPRANNVFATAAASKYALNIDKATAVGEINTDANAPVEYYNLQGVKVENPENGIFIRKQGSKTTKVVL